MATPETNSHGADDEPMKYEQFYWGELCSGSKSQLQRLGLGVGLAFPGEPGGPLMGLKVCDARGFEWNINYSSESPFYDYYASVSFPWARSSRKAPDRQKLAGDVALERRDGADVYVGTMEGLVGLALARADQFPGAPGRGKSLVTINVDGIIPTRNPTRDRRRSLPAGVKTIRPAGKTRYELTLFLSRQERSKRVLADMRERVDESLSARATYQVYQPKMLRPMSEAAFARLRTKQDRAKGDPGLQAFLATIDVMGNRRRPKARVSYGASES